MLFQSNDPRLLPVDMIGTAMESNPGRKHLVYMTEGTQGGKSSGDYGRIPMVSFPMISAPSLMVSYFPYTLQAHQGRDGMTHSGLGHSTSVRR